MTHEDCLCQLSPDALRPDRDLRMSCYSPVKSCSEPIITVSRQWPLRTRLPLQHTNSFLPLGMRTCPSPSPRALEPALPLLLSYEMHVNVPDHLGGFAAGIARRAGVKVREKETSGSSVKVQLREKSDGIAWVGPVDSALSATSEAVQSWNVLTSG